ncbi:MAG: hypothetical protein R3B13_25220 [Polyangiaceae bacterium]
MGSKRWVMACWEVQHGRAVGVGCAAMLGSAAMLGCAGPNAASPAAPTKPAAASSESPEPAAPPACDPGPGQPPTKYRQGDWVLYRYSGSFTSAPVMLREEVTKQCGNHLEIEVNVERASERRRWLQVLTDTPENQANNVVDELYVYEGDEKRRLANEKNADIYRLYEWTVVNPDGKPTGLSTTSGWSALAGLPFRCQRTMGESSWQKRPIGFESSDCDAFLWTHGTVRFWEKDGGADVLRVEVLDFGKGEQSQGLRVPKALESRRADFVIGIGRALAGVERFAQDNGWGDAMDGLYQRAEIFDSQAALWERMRELAKLPVSTAMPTDGLVAGVEGGVLLAVTPEEYTRVRAAYASTGNAWSELIAHELVHRLHVNILGGDEAAMGPQWFYEGFAVLGSGQSFAKQRKFRSNAEALGSAKSAKGSGSYAVYGAALRHFAARVSLAEMIRRAKDADFEAWLTKAPAAPARKAPGTPAAKAL